jgi:hypothetical protein
MKDTQNKWKRWIWAYKAINTHRYNRLKSSKTESFYEKYLHIKPKKKVNPIMKYLNGLLWMAVPVWLILWAIFGCISYMAAILLVILYHFIAMHIVIMMWGYLKK